MGTVYEELDEAKSEIEKLSADYRKKLELSESLKRAHNEQQSKFQEANLKMEKFFEELNEKAEEISVAKQMCEELKSNLKEKEIAIKHLTCANEKLRADCKEKLQSCEEDSRVMAFALDEANAKNTDQEQQIRSLKEEIEGLKGIVSVSQIKCLEGDNKSKAAKEVKQREDVLLKLEEDKGKYENQLKWKKEQFGHLEEAHQKLRHQFQVSEKEWEREKASMVDEISRLRTDLDSQTRISETLQNRLQMCNQALAHEESKRKYLEIQLSESETRFDNVFVEYEDAKSTIESLTGQRDKEIAALRNSLGTRESLYKEMEYQVRMLKQENQELMVSLKELQEAQIQDGGGSYSSLTKLRNKLRGLEQVHKDCAARLKSKEGEWNTQLEILVEKLNCCTSELESRNTLIDHLKMEAEAHDSLIVQQALCNEEAALMILLLKSGLLEAKVKLADAYADLDHKNEENQETLSLLRGLQKVHEDCSARLKSKEAEWNCQLKSLMEKLNSCSSELEGKKTIITQYKMEAEAHDSIVELLALHDEEAAVMVLVLKAALMEAQMKLSDAHAGLDQKNQVSEQNLSLYRGLEQVHKDFSARLGSKEAEWNSQLEILMEKLKCCNSELECKNIMIDQLAMEAEASDSMVEQLTLHDEEAAVMVLVLKAALMEAQMKLADAHADLDRNNQVSEENFSLYRGLEQVHKDCSARLKSKEAEWNSQLEILVEKLKCCSSELEGKNIMIDQLAMEAEASDSMVEQLTLHDEEAAVMVLVLKAALMEAQMKLADAHADLDRNNQASEENFSLYRGLEQVHKDCSARLKSKEAEWNSQLEILVEKLKCCSSELEGKNIMIDQLTMDAEAHDSMVEQLTLHDEEASLMVLVLTSEFMGAHRKLVDAYADLDEKNKEANDSLSQLMMQLEMKNNALIKAQKDTEEERKKASHLSEKVESTSFLEEQQLLQHKELDRLEKMLSESHTCQSELKKQVLRMKSELKEVHHALNIANEEQDEQICRRMESEFGGQIWRSFIEQLKTNLEENHQIHRDAEASLHAELRRLKSDLKKVYKALDRVNEEVAERFCKVNEAEFELQIWKSVTEQLKANLEENHQMRREVEASLLAEVALEVNLKQEKESLLHQLEEKDKRIDGLCEQITQLNQELETRIRRNSTPSTKNAKFRNSEQRTTLQTVEAEEEWVKKELEGAILAQVDAEENYEHEKESLHQLVEERDQRIEHLQQLVKSLEQEFESSTSSFSSRLSGMQLEINLFREAWNKIATAMVLKEIETEEKNLIILELENDLIELKTCLQANKSEVQTLRGKLEEEQSRSDVLIEKLHDEKDQMVEDVMKLSTERENLLDTLGGLSDRMNKLSMEDMQLMESLRSIMQTFDSNELGAMNFRREDDESLDSMKENKNLYSSPRTKKAEAIVDERLPFRALNS